MSIRLALFRATSRIERLDGLTPVAEVGPDSSAWPRMHALKDAPVRRHVWDPLGPELPPGAGLYVHTPHPSAPQDAWYALAPAGQRTGAPAAALLEPVREQDAPAEPLLIWQGPGGRQRLYVRWEDDSRFPEQPDGRAFAFWVGLPPSAQGRAAPLPVTVHLHAWGEAWTRFFRSSPPGAPGSPYDLPTAWLELDDPSNTWWLGYGVAMTPAGAQADLYTFQRLERTLSWVLEGGAGFRADADRVVLYGGSMGGTGAVAASQRLSARLAGVYALSPLVQPARSVWGKAGFERLFGPRATPFLTPDGRSLYDHLDLLGGLERAAVTPAQRSSDLPLTITVHGRADTIVEWQTQGRPWLEARDHLTLPGPGLFVEGDHNQIFDSFDRALVPSWQPSRFSLSRKSSFPVFSQATGDDDLAAPLPACRGADPLYRLGQRGGSILWSTPETPIAGLRGPDDRPARYQLGLQLRSDLCGIPEEGTARVRIQRRQQFRPQAGETVTWEVVQQNGTRAGGRVTLPESGALILPAVPITRQGGLLTVTRQSGSSQNTP